MLQDIAIGAKPHQPSMTFRNKYADIETPKYYSTSSSRLILIGFALKYELQIVRNVKTLIDIKSLKQCSSPQPLLKFFPQHL